MLRCMRDGTRTTAPQGRRTSSAAEGASGEAATSASRNVGRFVAVADLPSRFPAASQEAKVGYLMPHWAANCGALRLLAS